MRHKKEGHLFFTIFLSTALVFNVLLGTLMVLGLPSGAQAIPPIGYYSNVNTSSPTLLRQTLHAVIDDHLRFPYSSTETDTWDVLEQADQDPNDPGSVLDIYKNQTYPKFGGGNSYYNREHTWPKSMGFPVNNGSGDNYPYTDCHMLFISDLDYNNARGHFPFRYCDQSCNEKPTVYNNGQGGGSGNYPGNSNWRTGNQSTGTWETWNGRRGDVARALFYADVRYEGGLHGVTGFWEPDLILCDSQSLISNSITGANETVAYMGLLWVLLEWHYDDPVDQLERSRNDVVYSFQGNRNPFIDHPEWVSCLFEGVDCEAECETSGDCDDQDLCTIDECIHGACDNTPITCPAGQTCEDGICVEIGGCGA